MSMTHACFLPLSLTLFYGQRTTDIISQVKISPTFFSSSWQQLVFFLSVWARVLQWWDVRVSLLARSRARMQWHHKKREEGLQQGTIEIGNRRDSVVLVSFETVQHHWSSGFAWEKRVKRSCEDAFEWKICNRVFSESVNWCSYRQLKSFLIKRPCEYSKQKTFQ